MKSHHLFNTITKRFLHAPFSMLMHRLDNQNTDNENYEMTRVELVHSSKHTGFLDPRVSLRGSQAPEGVGQNNL